MANDPGLLTDTCSFMESFAGDGGTHTGALGWWLSPDIKLTGPVSGADSADFNVNNPVNVTAHLKSGCTILAGTNNILVDLYVGNPSLAMSPGINTKLIDTALLPVASFSGGKLTKTIQFKPTGSGTDPDAAGHRCLIARCYSELLTPDVAAFHLPEDQHYVQHNITVVAAPAGGQMKMNISTGNPDKKANQHLVVKVSPDLNPSRALLALATPQAKQFRQFTQFTKAAPQAIHLDVNAFRVGSVALTETVAKAAAPPPAVKVASKVVRAAKAAPVAKVAPVAKATQLLSASSDFFKLSAVFAPAAQTAKVAPNLELTVNLKPQFFATFAFTADLSHAKKGEASIYHLTQTGADGRVHGGLTVIVVAT